MTDKEDRIVLQKPKSSSSLASVDDIDSILNKFIRSDDSELLNNLLPDIVEHVLPQIVDPFLTTEGGAVQKEELKVEEAVNIPLAVNTEELKLEQLLEQIVIANPDQVITNHDHLIDSLIVALEPSAPVAAKRTPWFLSIFRSIDNSVRRIQFQNVLKAVALVVAVYAFWSGLGLGWAALQSLFGSALVSSLKAKGWETAVSTLIQQVKKRSQKGKAVLTTILLPDAIATRLARLNVPRGVYEATYESLLRESLLTGTALITSPYDWILNRAIPLIPSATTKALDLTRHGIEVAVATTQRSLNALASAPELAVQAVTQVLADPEVELPLDGEQLVDIIAETPPGDIVEVSPPSTIRATQSRETVTSTQSGETVTSTQNGETVTSTQSGETVTSTQSGETVTSTQSGETVTSTQSVDWLVKQQNRVAAVSVVGAAVAAVMTGQINLASVVNLAQTETARAILFGYISQYSNLSKFAAGIPTAALKRLSVLEQEIPSLNAKNRKGALKEVFDLIYGRFYTEVELRNLPLPDLLRVARERGLGKKELAPAGLRRWILKEQNTREKVTYQRLASDISESLLSVAVGAAGTAVVTGISRGIGEVLIQKQQAYRNTLVTTINDAALQTLLSAEQIQSFNLAVTDPAFLEKNLTVSPLPSSLTSVGLATAIRPETSTLSPAEWKAAQEATQIANDFLTSLGSISPTTTTTTSAAPIVVVGTVNLDTKEQRLNARITARALQQESKRQKELQQQSAVSRAEKRAEAKAIVQSLKIEQGRQAELQSESRQLRLRARTELHLKRVALLDEVMVEAANLTEAAAVEGNITADLQLLANNLGSVLAESELVNVKEEVNEPVTTLEIPQELKRKLQALDFRPGAAVLEELALEASIMAWAPGIGWVAQGAKVGLDLYSTVKATADISDAVLELRKVYDAHLGVVDAELQAQTAWNLPAVPQMVTVMQKTLEQFTKPRKVNAYAIVSESFTRLITGQITKDQLLGDVLAQAAGRNLAEVKAVRNLGDQISAEIAKAASQTLK